MKPHNEKITNMMSFCLFCWLFTFCKHKHTKNRKDGFSWLSEVQMFSNLVDAFNSIQYTMLKSYFSKYIICLCMFSDVNKGNQFVYILKKKTVKGY